jgi:hypothetical protein
MLMNMRDSEFFVGRVQVANSVEAKIEKCECKEIAKEKQCPDCGAEVFPSSGCWICLSCGYSPCK